MTWKEAIRKVLLEEGGPLHYTDITTRIFESGYMDKNECGATPEQTVCAQLATKKEFFRQLGNGVYELVDPTVEVATHPESKSEKKQVKEEAEQIERNNIIKNFGMFWSRTDVDWKSMNSMVHNESILKLSTLKSSAVFICYMMHVKLSMSAKR